MAEAARRFYDEQLKEDERKRVYVEKRRKLTPQQKFIKEKRQMFYAKPRFSLEAISEASSPFPHTFDSKSWSLPKPFQKEGFLFSSPRFIQQPAEFAHPPFDFKRKYPIGFRSHVQQSMRKDDEDRAVVDAEAARLLEDEKFTDHVDPSIADSYAPDGKAEVYIEMEDYTELEPALAERAIQLALDRRVDIIRKQRVAAGSRPPSPRSARTVSLVIAAEHV